MAESCANLVEGHLEKECPICYSDFKEPKALNCLHVFCLKCLEELRQSQDPNSAGITCPLCRLETALEGKGVSHLPDHLIIRAVEEVAVPEQLLEGQGSEIKCQACDEGNPAVSRCEDCEHFLCCECRKAHKRMTLMKSHKIFTMAQLGSGATLKDVPKCAKHSDLNVGTYCETCSQFICTDHCSLLDHENHALSDLTEALEKCKQDVAELVAKVKKCKVELTSSQIETEESHRRLDTMFTNTNKKISREVAKAIEDGERLKQEASEIYLERIKTIQSAEATNSKEMDKAEQMIHTANRHMAQSTSCFEMQDFQQELSHYHQELADKQPDIVQDGLSFMDFEEDEWRLLLEVSPPASPKGLCPEEKWRLQKEITTFGSGNVGTTVTFACDVASFSNNEIVVSEIHHNVLMKLPDLSCSIPPIINIGNVTRVFVNKYDQLNTLHSTCVQIFRRDYQRLHTFQPELKTPSTATCLAVDDTCLIALGYTESKEIHLHSPDGSFIKKLDVPMLDEHLTVYKQRLIYTNWKLKKLVSVDYDGVELFSTDVRTIASWWGPTGVCCDSKGFIYVGVCGRWPTPGQIQKYSPNGDYIGCIVEKCGTVYGITLTRDDKYLVVAQRASVGIYGLITIQSRQTGLRFT